MSSTEYQMREKARIRICRAYTAIYAVYQQTQNRDIERLASALCAYLDREAEMHGVSPKPGECKHPAYNDGSCVYCFKFDEPLR